MGVLLVGVGVQHTRVAVEMGAVMLFAMGHAPPQCLTALALGWALGAGQASRGG